MSPASSAAAAHLDDPVLPTSTAGSRPKRRLSNAAQAAWMDAEMDDGMLDDDEPKSRASKRSRAAAQLAGGGLGGSPKQGGGAQGGVPPKALTEKEKEARRVARMIRNRNAAQASRDRKKEHILWLERRVGELEQLVRQSGIKVSAGHSPFFAGGSVAASPAQNRLPAIPRNQRETSVVSESSSSGSGRVADLEEENDSLRSQLHLEQSEKQELRARLEEVEEQLARVSQAPDATLAPSFSPFSNSLVPLPYTEPTFAFDTQNLSPLPQPQELAFVEARDRQRQLASRRMSATPESGSDGTGKTEGAEQTSDGSSRLVAPEATQESVAASSPLALALSASSLVADTPSLTSSASSTSSRSSVLELDISSTPPATESYLDLEDAVVAPVWSDWAKGVLLPDESSGKPGAAEDESALVFLDLSAFHDAPAAIASH
ncbi:Basic-leucine zipper (bZIP) transcription factor [Rhodotorula toruloides NP11]|uniref:Basic-leucine zipper (BZIP) transcription factor n=1 Tax=Rhodotorula toruloides (strain NP11) TaxID=1130832 RepID=M7WQX7_RHOT1|nr:Basic-leucine zipper (bZIP) transcription factor [Rhodotorula toruloides NP11]EMS22957.1 Basic-leucine zipper (bZIP) transcription factor [Rhodotorula toruloides NP11]